MKRIFQLSLTILIPLLYLLNIFVIKLTPNTAVFLKDFVLLGIVLSIAGLILWILSMVNLGRNFGVLPQKQKRIKTGLYKYFNHPMYLGIILTFLGLTLASASLQGLMFLVLITTPLLFIRARLEDEKLL